MRRIPLATPLALLFAAGLAAQPAMSPGARVRVTGRASVFAGDASPHIGTVTSSGGDALTFLPEFSADTLRLRYADLARMDVSRGRKDRKVRGAVLGGLITGAGFVSLACAFSNGSCDIGQDVGGFLAYFAVGAVPGVILGVIVGSGMRGPEQWRTVWTGASGDGDVQLGASESRLVSRPGGINRPAPNH